MSLFLYFKSRDYSTFIAAFLYIFLIFKGKGHYLYRDFTIFDEISTALADGDRVEIRGLCSFFVKKYQSYQGRNPKTGESFTVASKKLPFFKIGKELKERVDY